MNSRIILPIGLLLITILSSGCDGHIRTLYLNENVNASTPWGIRVSTIQIASGQNVLSVVRRVAEDLGLRPDPYSANAWFGKSGQFSFYLSVSKLSEGKWKGIWEIGLLDWPTFQRSDLSKQVEELILSSLNTPSN